MQNMNAELVAQMFKNYQSNVLFHLEGMPHHFASVAMLQLLTIRPSDGRAERAILNATTRGRNRSAARPGAHTTLYIDRDRYRLSRNPGQIHKQG